MRNMYVNKKSTYVFALIYALVICFFVSSSFGADTAFAVQKKSQEIYRTNDNGERIDLPLQNNTSWTVTKGKMKLNYGAETTLSFVSSDTGIAVISNGYLIPKKSGVIELTITAKETNEYDQATHIMNVILLKEKQHLTINTSVNKSVFNLSERSYKITADWDDMVKTSLTSSTSNKNIATIDENKVIHFYKGGTATLTLKLEENDFYEGDTYYYKVRVIDDVNPHPDAFSGSITSDPGSSESNNSSSVAPVNDRVKQNIGGPSNIIAPFGLKVNLKQTASTALSYKSSNNKTATVSAKGEVNFKKPGSVKIFVTAAASKKYLSQKKTITVSAKIKKPKLKVKRRKGSNKLIWSKVEAACRYELFVKYPSASRFVKAVTRKGKVKSVTHSDLARKKVYKYKVRACVKAGKKKFYSPFSKTIKIRSK